MIKESKQGTYRLLQYCKILYDKLSRFYHQLNEFRNLVPQSEETKNKNRCIEIL